ncbi:hypothetical protein PR048_030263 [Dryococelus australis]|uniref:Uncharacterized protein n=1 Tax=Dryococelus australis TaxID=614101 RepID=A0ABQ9GCE1_9NEOP|nr:hypothetical protein PR048_030263 [Dryococelus australis]
MEGNHDNAQTLLSNTGDGHQPLMGISSDVDAYIENENVCTKVMENVENGAEASENTIDKASTVVDACEACKYVKDISFNNQAADENTVSNTQGFVNTVNETHTFEENVDGACDFAENAINETCAIEENDIDHTQGFRENGVIAETDTFEETVNTVNVHSFVDSSACESIAYKDHILVETHNFLEEKINKVHDVAENAIDVVAHNLNESTCDKSDKILNSRDGDIQAFMNNDIDEAGTFVNSVTVEDKIFEEEEEEGVQHHVFRDDTSSEDHGSIQDTHEDKASNENEGSEAHSTSGNSKVSIKANKESHRVVEAIGKCELKVPHKLELDLKCYSGPVTGRRSYRSDLAGPSLPHRMLISERLRPSAESSISRDRRNSLNRQNDGVGGKKRKMEEMPVQVAKRKKVFPFSLFSYLSYLSPTSLLSLLRPARQDVVLQPARQDMLKEVLLTDESDDECD